MQSSSKFCAIAAAAIFAVTTGVGSARADLPGEEIKKLVNGKRVFLSVPLGGEFPLRYNTNGVVAGSGDGVGLGRFMQPSDAGRWWVADNKLCQQWKSWYDGKTFCFTITKTGPNTIAWKRDDGYAGTARITN